VTADFSDVLTLTNAEEMFCTEAEAQAAGYRRAKVR
jgi:hypothetical protein